jgi:hypothetical protein
MIYKRTFVTNSTFELLLFLMNWLFNHAPLFLKFVVTKFTYKWLLFIMNRCYMNLQFLLQSKDLVTSSTFKCFFFINRYNLLITLERRLRKEILIFFTFLIGLNIHRRPEDWSLTTCSKVIFNQVWTRLILNQTRFVSVPLTTLPR